MQEIVKDKTNLKLIDTDINNWYYEILQNSVQHTMKH